MKRPSRRDFLKLLTSYLVGISGAVGLAGIGRYLSYDSGPGRKTEFDVGPVESFPIGSRTRRVEIPAIILRSNDGFDVLSLECTHLGCTVEDSPEGFLCPCHGSQYDMQGGVTRGPARRPLARLRAAVDAEGKLIVHTD